MLNKRNPKQDGVAEVCVLDGKCTDDAAALPARLLGRLANECFEALMTKIRCSLANLPQWMFEKIEAAGIRLVS